MGNENIHNTENGDESGKWYNKKISGLSHEGMKVLSELEDKSKSLIESRNIDKRQLRYLKQLKKMRLITPNFYKKNIPPKVFYNGVKEFFLENDIPHEIISRVVPVLVTYIETGHMRPVLFVGDKGCGKTTAAKLIAEEILQLPSCLIKIPQTSGGHGMTGDSGIYLSADAGYIAKARIDNDSLLVVYTFDEIDKPPAQNAHSNAVNELLSITDESCSDIYDSYLEVPLVGLEHCPMFFTANDLKQVNPVLADRCTVIKYPNPDVTASKSIGKKYAEKILQNNIYKMIEFDNCLLDNAIEKLIENNVTSLRKHQQLVEAVINNALHVAMEQPGEEQVSVTKTMFIKAMNDVMESEGSKKIGF